MLSVHT